MNVCGGEYASKRRDSSLHFFKLYRRLALAQVRQRPDGVAGERCGSLRGVDKVADFGYDALVKESISKPCIVTRNVAKAPDCLLLNLDVSW